jgi:uncharacterized membrane protein
MTAQKNAITLGQSVYGLGIATLGVLCLVWGAFDPGQPVPKDFPYRTTLAYASGAIMLVAGAAVVWRRTVTWGAAALTVYYTLVVVVLMQGRVILRNYTEFMAYSNAAAQVALAACGLIIYAASAKFESRLAARLTRLGQLAFGVSAVLFGGAHFFYMNLTAPLVPTWLPPSQLFWGYATGVCHIAAGVAILTGVQARLAAILLTVMFASFALLVFTPMLVADSANHMNWTENAVTIALVGAAWVVANSLARPRR